MLSRQNQLTLATLSDGRRAILYGALGMIALLIAGSDELFSTGGGTLALDPAARRLDRGDLADLDRRQHLLALSRRGRRRLNSRRLSAPRVRSRLRRSRRAATDRQQRRPQGGGDRLGRADRGGSLPAAGDPGGGTASARRAGALVGGRRGAGRRAGGAGRQATRRRRRDGRCRRRCAPGRRSSDAATASRCEVPVPRLLPGLPRVTVGARTGLGAGG